MATTPDIMYKGILTRLKADTTLDDYVHNDYVYISHQPLFTQEDDQYIQVVPGVPTSITSQAGYYLVREEFDVTIWNRLYLDQGRRSTDRFAHATLGVLKLMSLVRSRLMNHLLVGSDDTTASLPITFERGRKLFASDEHPGWCYMSDTFAFGYEIT